MSNKKNNVVPEIKPEEMPAFLNNIAQKFKNEEGQETMWKLAQCSFYIFMCNSMLNKQNNEVK